MSDPSFPTSTSTAAGQKAARRSGLWRAKILDRLIQQPSTLFEVAAFYGVPDHTISGRFTALKDDGLIERSGERRRKPESGCEADVWRIVRDRPAAGVPDLAQELGYPLTLRIGDELYDRQPTIQAESYPGFPYARKADTGGVRLNIRVALVECPGCGKPLMPVEGGTPRPAGQRLYRCNVPTCNQTWRPTLVAEPGKSPVLALVMERF